MKYSKLTDEIPRLNFILILGYTEQLMGEDESVKCGGRLGFNSITARAAFFYIPPKSEIEITVSSDNIEQK